MMDRALLYDRMEAFLDALVRRDATRVPWSDGAVITENNVRLEPGDGIWNTVDGRRGYDLKMADPSTGQVAWFGVIEEHGRPAIMALRLKLEGERIAEAEAIVTRKVENSPFPSIDTYIEPRPLMLADVPPARRVARESLIANANGYFDTLQLNDGTLRTQFTEDCNRREDGLQSTNNPAATLDPLWKLGCEAQFRMGQYRYDDRLRDRRFLTIDEERGIVLAGGFIDHEGRLGEFTLTDGSRRTSIFRRPHSFALLEAFKIRGGKIQQIEAVFLTVPYNTRSVWRP